MKPDKIKSYILETIQKVTLDKNKIDQFCKSNQFPKNQSGKTFNYYQNGLLIKQQYTKALSSFTRMQQLLAGIKLIDLTKGKTSEQNLVASVKSLIDEINSYSIQLNALKQYHDNQKPYLEHGIKSINACRAYLNGLIQSSVTILQSVQKITNSLKTNQKGKSDPLNVQTKKYQEKKQTQRESTPFEIIKSINSLTLQIQKEITLFFNKEFPNKVISPNRNVITYPPSFLSFHYYKDFKTLITKLKQKNQLILKVKNLQTGNTKEYCTSLQNLIQQIKKDFQNLNNIDKSIYKEPQQQIINHLQNLENKFFKIIDLKSILDSWLVKCEQKKQAVDNSPLKSSRNSSMNSQTEIRKIDPESEKKIMMDSQQQSKIRIKNTIKQSGQNPQISKILEITSQVKNLILSIEDKNKQVRSQNMYVNKNQLNKIKLQNQQVETNIMSLFDKLYQQKPNRSKLRTQSMEQKQGSTEQKHKSSEDSSEQFGLMVSKQDYQQQIQKRLTEFEKNINNEHTKKINHLKNQYEDKISKIKEQIKKSYEDRIGEIEIEFQIKQQQYKTQIAELQTMRNEANTQLTKRNEDIKNLKTNVQETKQKVEDLQVKLSSKSTQFQQHKTLNISLTQKVALLNPKIIQFTQKLTQLQQQNKQLKSNQTHNNNNQSNQNIGQEQPMIQQSQTNPPVDQPVDNDNVSGQVSGGEEIKPEVGNQENKVKGEQDEEKSEVGTGQGENKNTGVKQGVNEGQLIKKRQLAITVQDLQSLVEKLQFRQKQLKQLINHQQKKLQTLKGGIQEKTQLLNPLNTQPEATSQNPKNEDITKDNVNQSQLQESKNNNQRSISEDQGVKKTREAKLKHQQLDKLIDQKVTELEQANQQLNKKLQQLNRANTELELTKNVIGQNNQKISSFQAQLKQLESQYQFKLQSTQTLTKQHQSPKKQKQSTSALLSNAQQQLQSTKQQINLNTSLVANINAEQKQTDLIRTEINKLNSQMDTKKAEIQTINQQINTNKKQLEEINIKVNDKMLQLNEIQSKQKELTHKIQLLTEKLKGQTLKIQNLQSKAQLTLKIKQIQHNSTIANLSNNLTQIQNQIATKEKELQTINSQHQTKFTEFKNQQLDIQNQIKSKQEQIQSYEKQITDKKSQLQETQKSIILYKTQLTQLKSQQTIIADDISKKHKQNGQLESQKELVKQEINRLTQTHQEELNQRFGQFKELSLAQTKIHELNETIISKGNQIILVKQHLASKQQQILKLEKTVIGLKKQITTQQESYRKLQQTTRTNIQDLSNTLQSNMQKIGQLQGEIKQKEANNAKLNEMIQTLQSQLSTLNSQHQTSSQTILFQLKQAIQKSTNIQKIYIAANTQLQTKKTNLQQKLQESNKQLKKLKQQHEKDLSQMITDDAKKLTKAELAMKKQFEETVYSMRKELEDKKQYLIQKQNKVQQQAAAKLNKIIQQFNEINTKLSKQSREINEKYRQAEELKMSYHFFLKKIYVAFLTYDDGLDGKDSKAIQEQWNDQKKLLTTQDSRLVLQKSLQVISKVQKMRLGQKRVFQNHINNVNDTYEAKINQLIQSVDKLTNTQQFKRTLSEVDKHLGKPTEIKHNIDKLQLAIYKFAKKADQFIDGSIEAMNKAAENQKFDMAKVISEKQHEVEVKNAQLLKKQSQLKVLREKIQKQLQGQMQKLQQTASENLAKYHQEHENSSKLQEEIQALKNRDIVSLKRQLEEMRTKNDELYKQVNQLRNQNESSSQNYNQLLSRYQSMQLELQDLEDKNLTLTEQIQHLKSTTQQLSATTNQQLSLLQSRNQSLTKELLSVRSLLERHQKQVAEKTTQVQSLKSQLNQQRSTANSKGVILQAVQSQLNKCRQEKDDLKTRIMTLEKQFKIKNDEERKSCENLMNAMKKQEQQIVSLKQTFGQISNTLAVKMRVNRQFTPDTIIQAIDSYSPPVGKVLITSTIMLGLDSIRPQIIAACQKFAKKTFSKSTVLFRFPDSKNMVSVLASKELASNPFIILYKTMAGWVVGSYSEGMKKPTFFFSFGSEEYDNRFETEEEAKKLKIHMPETPSEILPIEFLNARFLQYGNGEFKVSAVDLSSGTANSDVVSNRYYGFDWKNVFRDKNESKIMLSEVEVHRIELA